MPAKDVCDKLNDPCQADLYDESIEFVDQDGRGNFSFSVHRDAAHAMKENEPPDTVASDAALYRYAWNGSRWLYSEEKLADQDGQGLAASPRQGCTPNLPVTADMANADYSPFGKHRAH
jgi:hypothetical protein